MGQIVSPSGFARLCDNYSDLWLQRESCHRQYLSEEACLPTKLCKKQAGWVWPAGSGLILNIDAHIQHILCLFD